MRAAYLEGIAGMRRTAIAVGVAASIGLAAAASAPAALGLSALHITVSPTKPKPGALVTAKVTNATPHAKYYCILTLHKPGVRATSKSAYIPSLVRLKASSRGTMTCHQVFVTFHGTYQGKTHYCPPKPADKRAGWGCAVTIINQANYKQHVYGSFKF
jgi:hypothetical protein